MSAETASSHSAFQCNTPHTDAGTGIEGENSGTRRVRHADHMRRSVCAGSESVLAFIAGRVADSPAENCGLDAVSWRSRRVHAIILDSYSHIFTIAPSHTENLTIFLLKSLETFYLR